MDIACSSTLHNFLMSTLLGATKKLVQRIMRLNTLCCANPRARVCNVVAAEFLAVARTAAALSAISNAISKHDGMVGTLFNEDCARFGFFFAPIFLALTTETLLFSSFSMFSPTVVIGTSSMIMVGLAMVLLLEMSVSMVRVCCVCVLCVVCVCFWIKYQVFSSRLFLYTRFWRNNFEIKG